MIKIVSEFYINGLMLLKTKSICKKQWEVVCEMFCLRGIVQKYLLTSLYHIEHVLPMVSSIGQLL